MTGSKWTFSLAAFLMFAIAETARLGFSDRPNTQKVHGTVTAKSSVLHLKESAIDVERLVMRAVESPEPPTDPYGPSPTPDCEPPRQEDLNKACDNLDAKEQELKNACKAVRKAQKKLNALEEKLRGVEKEIDAEDQEKSNIENEIRNIENLLEHGFTNEEERKMYEQKKADEEQALRDVERKLRSLQNKKDAINSDVNVAEADLKNKKSDKQDAELDVKKAAIEKRQAQKALDKCLESKK